MSWALDQFFASVEDEFDVAIADADREYLATPRDVIDFVAEATVRDDTMDDDEHRENIGAVIGELMAQTLGVTRYNEDTRFVEDLRLE